MSTLSTSPVEGSKPNDTFKTNKTALIYDPVMIEYKCEWDDKYPEKPARAKEPYERCNFYGLTEKCVRLPGRYCTDEEVEKCHTASINQVIKDTEKMNHEELKSISEKYDSMYFSSGSNKAARFALGSSLDLLDSIMTGQVDNGFAIIRPPGHHAMCNAPNGYCYFNNAAITAKTAIEKYCLSRVMIIDWDAHHGQGVQYAFYDDPRVLYCSLHRYDYGKFWPNLRQGDFDYIGQKGGKGYNINIPLNKTGLGNSEYSAAFYNLILPIAYEFKPELVIVASGYDAAIGCFEGRMRVTPAGYAHFLNALSCLSNGKLCVLLEGGYCIKSLSEGVALSVRALLGYPTPRVEDYKKPDPSFVRTLLNAMAVLRPYWKCLQNVNEKDSMSLESYLEDWDKNYRQNVAFYDNDNPPEKYDLTEFYPLWEDSDRIRLEKEIDELIVKTDLFIPKHKTSVCLTEEENLILNFEDFTKSTFVLDQRKTFTNFENVLDKINKREYSNGICLVNSYEQLMKETITQKELKERIKKVLIINISNEKLHENLNHNEDILFVSPMINSSPSTNDKNNIQLNLDSDTAFLTGFLRIILPISYQFNPDLVIIYISNHVSTQKSQLTLNCLMHIIKLLCALANGNTVVTFQAQDHTIENKTDSKLDQTKKCFYKIFSILMGESCDESPNHVHDEKLQNNIKSEIDNLKSNWDCLQFNEKIAQ